MRRRDEDDEPSGGDYRACAPCRVGEHGHCRGSACSCCGIGQ